MKEIFVIINLYISVLLILIIPALIGVIDWRGKKLKKRTFNLKFLRYFFIHSSTPNDNVITVNGKQLHNQIDENNKKSVTIGAFGLQIIVSLWFVAEIGVYIAYFIGGQTNEAFKSVLMFFCIVNSIGTIISIIFIVVFSSDVRKKQKISVSDIDNTDVENFIKELCHTQKKFELVYNETIFFLIPTGENWTIISIYGVLCTGGLENILKRVCIDNNSLYLLWNKINVSESRLSATQIEDIIMT